MHRQERTASAAFSRAALFTALFALGACTRKDAVPTDSALARDLALANQSSPAITFQDTSLAPASQPAAATVTPPRAPARAASRPERVTTTVRTPRPVERAPTPAPAREEPTPEPARAAAPTREIGAGTGVAMTTGGRVCSSSNRPGDKIVATIESPLTGSNGAVIPAGAKMVLEVASSSPDQDQFTFRARAIVVGETQYPVSGEVSSSTPLEKVKVAGNGSSDKKKVIGGAIAGAIIGQILGKDTKSTVIGAATGAAAGAVAAKAGEKFEACLPSGAPLHLTLSQPIVMS